MMSVANPVVRSPMSPYERQSRHSLSAPSHSQRHAYSTSPHPDAMAANRGLGLYPGTIPTSRATTVDVPSSIASDWSSSTIMEPEYPSSHASDIFSSAFDPFSGFSASSSVGMMDGSSPEAPGLEYCQSPPSSNVESSHRSSVSSNYETADSYSASGSEYSTPRIKAEEGDWYAAQEPVIQRTLSTQSALVYPTTTLASQNEDLYRTHSQEWSKQDTTSYLNDVQVNLETRMPRFGVPTIPSVTRIKKKRQRTTPEEATHECAVCGKLFKRSYNWKSHMETHNPDRKYPHPCTAMIGSTQCTKKFQRKTDLDRHYDSVHQKLKNHVCTLCGNRFARRDTLRRHTEDGCPKRFELGLREAPAHLPHSPLPRWNYPAHPPSSHQAYAPTTAPLPAAAASSSSSSSAHPLAAGAGRPRSYSLAVPSQQQQQQQQQPSGAHNHPHSPIRPLASSATFPLNYGSSRPEYASGMGATAFAA